MATSRNSPPWRFARPSTSGAEPKRRGRTPADFPRLRAPFPSRSNPATWIRSWARPSPVEISPAFLPTSCSRSTATTFRIGETNWARCCAWPPTPPIAPCSSIVLMARIERESPRPSSSRLSKCHGRPSCGTTCYPIASDENTLKRPWPRCRRLRPDREAFPGRPWT